MKTLEIVYKILLALERAMDLTAFDTAQIDHGAFGITPERWARCIEMLCDEGYIKGVRITVNSIGETKANVSRMRITLKGIDYLSNNPAMRKIAESTTGIVTIRFREQD